MTDNLSETPAKSGLILKAAREELSLTLDQVAHELHLRPSVVKAIEDENYDEFTSDVFLKGYFRSYCRLVNLHDTRMMELLDQQLLSRKKQAELKQQQITKLALSKKRKKLFITGLIFAVCLTLVFFAYYFTSLKDSFEDRPIIENNSPTNVIGKTSNSLEKLNQHTESPQELSTSSAESENSEIIMSESDSLPEAKLIASTPSSTDLVKDSIEEIEPEEIEVLNNIDQPVEQSLLTANFSGDCWFKLTDSTGKVKIAELKNSGEEINFSGDAPFHVVIGDANKVSLIFNQNIVDLSPYTSRNGRAELTLRPSTSVNEG